MGTRIELGAGVTVAQILSSRELDFLQPVAKCIGGPAIRNMATLGGNLFARAPYGDFTTALLTLDCRVNLTSPKGQQELPLEDFLADIGAYRQKIVASLSIQRPVSTDAFRFIKISRVKPVRAAVITIAAHLPQSGGRIQAARVAYGAMSPRPMRIASVEQALEGKLLDDRAIAAAMAVATEGCHPATDPIASDWYRREVAAVHLRRLLGAKTN